LRASFHQNRKPKKPKNDESVDESVFLSKLALLEVKSRIAEKEEGRIKNTNEALAEYRTTPAQPCSQAANPSRSFAAGRVTSKINFLALEIVCQRIYRYLEILL
jgi:hypothetical protein